jgi:hypothetical protein
MSGTPNDPPRTPPAGADKGAGRPMVPRADNDDSPPKPRAKADAVLCERCGAEMFRMHAVWRCPECGFKTDCCGW